LTPNSRLKHADTQRSLLEAYAACPPTARIFYTLEIWQSSFDAPARATRIWPSFAIKCSRISVSTRPGKARAGWFTEGPDTPDLQQARTLLDRLN
jgi:hypothetical protein